MYDCIHPQRSAWNGGIVRNNRKTMLEYIVRHTANLTIITKNGKIRQRGKVVKNLVRHFSSEFVSRLFTSTLFSEDDSHL